MKEEQDDLTLVYMFGFKNGRNSTKDEIGRLRARIEALEGEIRETAEASND